MTDPKLPNGTNYCQCSACGEYFRSPAAFDAHRKGPATDRHCDASGLVKNAAGYWVTGRMRLVPDYAVSHLRNSRDGRSRAGNGEVAGRKIAP